MFYSTTDGQYINEGQAFTIDGVQYPQNWLNLSTPEEKASIGLEEVIATNSPKSDQYYWVSTELNKATLTYVNTPKDLVQVKANAVSQVKDTAGKLLSQTDWYVIRKLDRNVDIPESIALKRTQIVTEANRLEIDINDSNTVEGLIEVLNSQNWSK